MAGMPSGSWRVGSRITRHCSDPRRAENEATRIMRLMMKLGALACAVATAALAADGWRMWSEKGDPVRHLREELRQGNEDARREAVGALSQQGSRGDAAELASALEDPEEEVRALALQGLPRLLRPGPGDAAAPAPREIFEAVARRARDDVSARVRADAIHALHGLAPEDPAARALFLAKLQDSGEDEAVRVAAYVSLGRGWQMSAPGLAYHSDPSPAVRLVAVECLGPESARPSTGKEGEPTAYPRLLVRALSDPDPRVRSAVLWKLPADPKVLARSYREAFPGLVAATSDPDPSIRQRACGRIPMAAGTDRAPEALAALVALLGDPEPAVQNTAVSMLEKFGAEAFLAIPRIIRADARRRRAGPGPGGQYDRQIRRLMLLRLAGHPPAW
jgi:HEAT repeat protein